MERIRYRKQDDGTLISIQTFKHPTNGAEYHVVLKQDGYEVQDSSNANLVAVSENAINSSFILKKKARKALENLGIPMNMGRRAKRNKEV